MCTHYIECVFFTQVYRDNAVTCFIFKIAVMHVRFSSLTGLVRLISYVINWDVTQITSSLILFD